MAKHNFKVENLDCSRLDPANPDKCRGHASGESQARYLMRWKKGPFKDYTWAFCWDCAQKSIELETAEIITEITTA